MIPLRKIPEPVKNIFAIASILMLLIFACKQSLDNGHLSGDLVDNPLTADGKPDTSRMPKIIFDTTEHTFGMVKEGQKVRYSFRFKNTGHAPLVISDASASCGCTTPFKPDSPILPGNTDSIVVEFNSTDHPGDFEKGVKIWSNTLPNTTMLKIQGDVKEDTKDN